MTIHAIFVAITEYPAGISQLPGCTNDLRAMRAFFADYASVNEADYKPTVLHNGDATRPKLIEAFRKFEAAGEDDVCVFYFSGHGSQVPAPREFWDQEPDRKCEALVLADYGQPSGGFLADKELSYLIATHTKAAGQVLLLVDSCHSGTISRSLSGKARTTALNIMDLRFTDFHGHEHYKQEGKYFHPEVGPHVILSACQPEQVAMEMPIRGVSHGLFTHYLIEVMSTINLGDVSYRELADRVRVRVKNHYHKQDLFAEASSGLSMDAQFFDGKLVRGNKQLLHYGKGIGWYFDRGQIAGVQVGDTAIILDGKEERTITVRRTDGGRSFVNPEDWLAAVKAPYSIIHLDIKGDLLPIYVDTESLSVYGNAVKERLEKEDATVRLVDN
ncbi:MAG: caspase family protein, partial [Bacteroidota bacterium]